MRSLSLLYIQWDLSFRRQWWRALMYCLVCGMCVKSLTKARHATLCANWSDWTPAPPPDILEYQHSKLRLLWYLHSIDLSWDAASFRHSARLVQGKFWSVWQKLRLAATVEGRDVEMEMIYSTYIYIVIFHIADVNLFPLQYYSVVR